MDETEKTEGTSAAGGSNTPPPPGRAPSAAHPPQVTPLAASAPAILPKPEPLIAPAASAGQPIVAQPATPRATNEPIEAAVDTIAEDVGLVKPAGQTPPRDSVGPSPLSRASARPVPKNPLRPYFFEPEESVMPKPVVPPPVREDIAKILSEMKLPERHTVEQGGMPPKAPPSPALIEEKPAPTTPAEKSESPSGGPGALPSVHTLKQDLLGVVRDQKVSLVRAAALESDKKREPAEPIVLAVGKKRNFGILFAALLLLFLGTGALSGVYFVMTAKSRAPQALDENALVFAERTVAFPLEASAAPLSVRSTLAQARSASGALGSFVHIVPTIAAAADEGQGTTANVRPATTAEFFRAVGSHPPDELMRAVSTNFFLGIHIVDENVPILVIPVTAYDHAFAAMLDWERTLASDLAPLYQPLPALINDGGIPTERRFTDVVMRNYDVRALRDDSGTIQLYYSFPTREILVIAESPYSFTEILSRLQAKRQL